MTESNSLKKWTPKKRYKPIDKNITHKQILTFLDVQTFNRNCEFTRYQPKNAYNFTECLITNGSNPWNKRKVSDLSREWLKGDPKPPFLIATTPKCEGRRSSILWIAHLLMLRVKQGGIKYHFLSFGMTRPGIEPRSPGRLAKTLLIKPMARFITWNFWRLWSGVIRRLPFQSLLYWSVGEGTTPFYGLLNLTLDPPLLMLSVKQGDIKNQFLSHWYDSTSDWTPVPDHWRTLFSLGQWPGLSLEIVGDHD